VQVDYAELSLIGHRQENQDRVSIIADPDSLLMAVADGMGGHSEGERAAQVSLDTLRASFQASARPIFDPQGFLTLALGRAHGAVVALGADHALDHRPRATCAVCLVQDDGTYWAHIGDSRIYLLRSGRVVTRTRDHSHVELLLQEGLITEEETKGHPMRNFVEYCLGGEATLPDMSVTARQPLQSGDVLLACTDGLWSGVADQDIGNLTRDAKRPLEQALRELVDHAVGSNAPYSDNTTAAALRWLG
jgi:serine/threonine protein phosphatase PrpC